ncbi:MAG: hypothetical protein Kow0069_27850 [Promethearchaeota archaeon]
MSDPTYPLVCTGKTGHAEAVEVTYDPDVVKYEELLDLFFEIHDPTMPNRQGLNVGSQYRSAVFCLDDEQCAAAREHVASLERSGRYCRPIATEVKRVERFYRAEEYHQRYYEKRGYAA